MARGATNLNSEALEFHIRTDSFQVSNNSSLHAPQYKC